MIVQMKKVAVVMLESMREIAVDELERQVSYIESLREGTEGQLEEADSAERALD